MKPKTVKGKILYGIGYEFPSLKAELFRMCFFPQVIKATPSQADQGPNIRNFKKKITKQVDVHTSTLSNYELSGFS